MEFKIFDENIERLDKKMSKYQRKFEKLGATLTYEKKQEVFEDFGSETHPEIRRFFIVEVSGFVRLEDWEILGKVEKTPFSENLLTCFKLGAFSIMQKFLTTKICCQHCNRKAQRRYSYILQHQKTQEIKMIGSSCLSEFVGINATAYASLLSIFDDLADFKAIPQNYSNGKKFFKRDILLSVASQIVETYGYTAKENFNEYGGCTTNETATVFAVKSFILGNPLHEKYKGFNFVENEPKTLLQVEELKTFFKNEQPQNQYENNLYLALQSEYVDLSKVGLLTASIITKKIKEQERKRIEDLTSNYVGEIGDKIELKSCKFEKVSSFDSQYGYVYIYKIINGNNTFVWKTSKFIENGVYDIKATIKAHKEFRNEKQTELTRVKTV